MARRVTTARKLSVTAAAWIVGFLIFFPILWMIVTSFKTELDAFSTPPKFLFFDWTMENYTVVQERSDYLRHALNSIILSFGSTLVGLARKCSSCWRRWPCRASPRPCSSTSFSRGTRPSGRSI
jgi:sorbitol/mannitol transport system permease protein